MRLKGFVNGEKFEVPLMKSKTNKSLSTNIPPSKRSFENLPKYADGKSKVRFQDWLMIKGEGESKNPPRSHYFGKSENGKWYGWSHRAVYGFKPGDKVTKNTCGSGGKEYTIKTDDQARQTAINFAKDVS